MNYLDKTGLTRLWSKVTAKLGQKQDTLVSGTNIKTINNETILGQGNINLSNYKLYGNNDLTFWYSYAGVKDIENINIEVDGNTHNIIEVIPMFLTEPISEVQYIIGEMAAYLKAFKVPATSYIDSIASKYLVINILGVGTISLSIIESNGEYIFDFIFVHSNYEDEYYYTVDISGETPNLEIIYALSNKQDRLVSGTNIKTINNESILGSGNIDVDNLVNLSNYSVGDTISDSTIVAKLKQDNVIVTNGTSKYRMADHNGSTYLYTVMNQVDGGDYIVLSESGNNLVVAIMDSTYWQLKIDGNNKLSADLISDGSTNKTVTSTEKTTWNNKQNALVSGTNIKTINSQSLLGSGNIEISVGNNTDVQINGTSIVSNDTANIVTNGVYNSSTNKIATMNDVPTNTNQLTNGAGFQNSTQVETAITSKGYITSSNVAFTNQSNSFSNNQTFNGGITVNGNITQNGSSYETHAQKVYTTNDYIYLRDGATGGLASGSYAGFQAKKYDGTNDGRLVFGNDGIARVGDVGDEQALATRAENPTNGATMVWDSSSLKMVSGFKIVSCTQAQYNSYTKDSNTIYLING